MSIFKKVNSRSIPVSKGEEKLHQVYDFKMDPTGHKVLVAGVDGGSTKTRVILLDPNNLEESDADFATPYIIPSVSKVVPDDRLIPAKSDYLYDNMDSEVTNTAEGQEKLFQKVRLVRGLKMTGVELKENRLKSRTQKTKDATYYYNILDGLGYALMMKYKANIPANVTFSLGVSLPPDDINPVNEAWLRKNLQKYIFTVPAFGVQITMVIQNIIIKTEPAAAVKGFFLLSGEDMPVRLLHIDGGGRSTGADIVVNEESLDSAQKTIERGGSQLQTALSDLYVAAKGGRPLGRDVLEEALNIGYIRDGDDTVQVMDMIAKVKEIEAQKLVDSIIEKVFDQQDEVAPTDLNLISASGRLFDPTILPKKLDVEGNELPYPENFPYPDGISVFTYMCERFKVLTPKTKYRHITENYIPHGLALFAMTEFFNFEDEDGDLANSEHTASAEAAATSEIATAQVDSAGQVVSSSTEDSAAGITMDLDVPGTNIIN